MTRLFNKLRNTHLYDSNIFLRKLILWPYYPHYLHASHTSNLDFLVSNIFYKVPISIKVFFVFLCVY
ncbi:hypothetical protein Bca4012_093816 [Brassica carinata]